MKIKMKQNKIATSDEQGSSTQVYEAGVVYDMSADWQMRMASKWLDNGIASQSVAKTQKKVIQKYKKRKKVLKKNKDKQ